MNLFVTPLICACEKQLLILLRQQSSFLVDHEQLLKLLLEAQNDRVIQWFSFISKIQFFFILSIRFSIKVTIFFFLKKLEKIILEIIYFL